MARLSRSLLSSALLFDVMTPSTTCLFFARKHNGSKPPGAVGVVQASTPSCRRSGSGGMAGGGADCTIVREIPREHSSFPPSAGVARLNGGRSTAIGRLPRASRLSNREAAWLIAAGLYVRRKEACDKISRNGIADA
jgi:hypothetical protein